MPEFKTDDVQRVVKDAFYVTVGVGVLAFQRIQVQRKELRKQVETQLGDAREQLQKAGKTVEERVKTIEERLESVEGRFESLFDQVEERLPDQAKDLVKQAREAAKDAQDQFRSLVTRQTSNSAAA
jgi:ElaB/YqjD/DUF883 family membrane-anchored ribosome-binding protein